MANIFDSDPPTPKSLNEEPATRSKKRETLSSYDITSGKRTLAEMVKVAFNTLECAMKEADFPTAVKAAQVILDRAGFGPKSTMDINTTNLDLSNLSREELAERAGRVAAMLRDQGKTVEPPTKPYSVN